MPNTISDSWSSPVRTWVGVLLMVFLTEITIMISLPFLMPSNHSRILESTVDSIVLTAVIGPVLWLSIVRPLREILRIRTRFLSGLFSEIEVDRKRTAYELHDGIGQPLSLLVSGLKSTLDDIDRPGLDVRLGNLRTLAESALQDVKRLATGLRPSLLDDLGLAPALERLVLDIRSNHAIDLALDIDDLAGARFSVDVETAVFRIMQEALSNIVQHSGADRAEVHVWRKGDFLRATIRDFGDGFDYRNQAIRRTDHLGLTGMKERATILEGDCSIQSRPDEGTLIQVSIPARVHDR